MNSTVDAASPLPAGLSPSGTVIVLRDEGAASVLMLRRQQSLRFLGGYWVFPGGVVDAAEMPAAAAGRAGVLTAAAAAACRELSEEAGLSLGVDALAHWAHWITPTAVPRRFDTHFFVAPAPAGQEPVVAAAESSEARWITLSAYRSAERSADFPLTPPTLIVLRELAEALAALGSVDALLRAVKARIVRPVLPKLLDGGMVVFPWDKEYPALPGGSLPWDAAGLAERAGWPARLPVSVSSSQ